MNSRKASIYEKIEHASCTEEEIIDYLDEFDWDEDVQWKLCKLLSEFEPLEACDVHPQHVEKREKLLALGVHKRVVNAMYKHQDSVNVQLYACWVLRNLGRPQNTKLLLLNIGAAACVVRAMDKYVDSDGVQQWACAALWNLAVNNSESKWRLMKMGAADRILRAMDHHISCENVQTKACGALQTLSFLNEHKLTLMKMGAGDKILRAMDKHLMSEKIQEKACGALWSLSSFHGVNKISLITMGVADSVQRAIDNHTSSECVKRKATGVFQSCFRLSHSNIDERAIKSLADALILNRSLAVLDLANNQIREQAAKSLADVLTVNRSLTSLKLGWNQIDDIGAKSFADALELNTTLTSLDLQNNRIGNEGLKNLANALKVNSSLVRLNLRRNLIEDIGAMFLTEVLKENSSLMELNLQGNLIVDKTISYLADALDMNTSLTNLRVPVGINMGIQLRVRKRTNVITEMQKQKFMDALASDQKAPLSCSRLMFVGQGKAGKSATVRSLLEKGFNPEWDSTIGANISECVTNSASSKWRNWASERVKVDFTSRFAARLMVSHSNTRNRANTKAITSVGKMKENNVNRVRPALTDSMNGSSKQKIATESCDNKSESIRKFNVSSSRSKRIDPPKGTTCPHLGQSRIKNDGVLREYKESLVVDAKRDLNSLTLSLWDFGGQQVFYSIHHIFLTQNGVYILVFDMRELLDPKRRNKALKCLLFWLRSIQLHAPTASLMITGTFFADIAQERDGVFVIDNVLRELVKSSFSQVVLNTDEDLVYFPIDNKEGLGMDKLRLKLEEQARVEDSVSELVPIRWVALLDKIYSKRDKYTYLTLFSDMRNLMLEVGIMSSVEQEAALALFHERGLVVHLTSTAVLKNIVVIQPQWLVHALSKVICDGNLHIERDEFKRVGLEEDLEITFEKGLASRDFLEYVWNGDQIDFFLDLMERTMLLSKWKDYKNRVYLIPSLLKEGLIEKESIKGSRCIIDFSNSFLPNGVFQRLLCLCVSHSVGDSEKRGGQNELIMEPRLQKHYAAIEFEPGSIIHLLEDEEAQTITVYVEDNEFANKCLRIIQAMLRKVNHDVMSSGLNWDIYLDNEVSKKLQIISEARLEQISPWFISEKLYGTKASSIPSAHGVDLASFLESLHY